MLCSLSEVSLCLRLLMLQMREKTGAFRVITGTYITSDAGTGVVHQAPYFGQVMQCFYPLNFSIPVNSLIIWTLVSPEACKVSLTGTEICSC